MSIATDKLRERAMLMHVRISMWLPAKKNDRVSRRTCRENEASEDAGEFRTFFIPKAELAPILTAANKVRNTWMRWTLPWMDGGIRIIPTFRLEPAQAAIQAEINSFNELVEEFITNKYPNLAATADKRLGKLTDGERMPPAEIARRKFGIKIDLLPIPRAEDSRIAGLEQQIEESLHAMMQRSMADVWDKLIVLVAKIQKTLDDPDKKFKNSLIKNLKEFCRLAPQLNLTESTSLDNMRNMAMKELASVDPDDLRDNGMIRKAVAKKAGEVLKQMNNTRKFDLDL